MIRKIEIDEGVRESGFIRAVAEVFTDDMWDRIDRIESGRDTFMVHMEPYDGTLGLYADFGVSYGSAMLDRGYAIVGAHGHYEPYEGEKITAFSFMSLGSTRDQDTIPDEEDVRERLEAVGVYG